MRVSMSTDIEQAFRRLSPERHPLLTRLTRDDVYDQGGWMAPGGLLLAHQMAEQLALAPGSTVLDLGCGRGQSSVFLATEYDVSVVSLDLWVSADERNKDYLATSAWLMRHVLHGRSSRPALTHLLLAATRPHHLSSSTAARHSVS